MRRKTKKKGVETAAEVTKKGKQCKKIKREMKRAKGNERTIGGRTKNKREKEDREGCVGVIIEGDCKKPVEK